MTARFVSGSSNQPNLLHSYAAIVLSGLHRCGLAQSLITFITTRSDYSLVVEAASLFKKFIHMSLALLPDAPFMLKELVDLVASNTSENKDCERATKLLRDLSNTKFGIY